MSLNTINSFLNEKFFKKALENALNKKLQICKFNVAPLGGNGENFCGEIYSATCDYKILSAENQMAVELLQKKFILKIVSKEMADWCSNEFIMYETVLTGMESELAAIGLNTEFRPNCFLLEKFDGNEVYALEDLRESGFECGNRFVGLNAAQTKVLLTKLAAFHAVSMVYLEKNPGIAELYKISYLEKGDGDPIVKSIVNDGMSYAAQVVSKWENFNEISEKMLKNVSSFFEKVRKIMALKNCGIKAIIHGDVWVNNSLMKIENGTPTDVRFLDYQNAFVGSPGYDLNFFMYTSVQLEVLAKQRLELLTHYHEELEKVLKRFQFHKIPSCQQLVDEVNKFALIGYYAAVSELPICSMNTELSQGFNATTFANDEIMAVKRPLMYENSRVLATLRHVLPFFNEMGILDA